MANIFSSNNQSAGINALTIADAFSAGLLEVGRKSIRGVGLSANSRALTNEYLSNVQAGFNSLMSLAAGPSLSIEGLLIQIKGLRASLPISMLDASALDIEALEKEAGIDNGSAAASLNGRNVDTTA
jgi:hypothetical protein